MAGSTTIRERLNVYEMITCLSCSSTTFLALSVSTGRPPLNCESRYVNRRVHAWTDAIRGWVWVWVWEWEWVWVWVWEWVWV